MTVHLIVCIAIYWHVIPDLTLTALQYLAVEYCEGNQRGRSWGATTSQEPWFWKDISWASSFEDICICKNCYPSWWKLLALCFGCCCFQQHLSLMKTHDAFSLNALGSYIFCYKYFCFFMLMFVWTSIQGLRFITYFSIFFVQFYEHFYIITYLCFFPFRFSTGLTNCVKSWVNALSLTWTKTNGLRTRWLCMLEHIR